MDQVGNNVVQLTRQASFEDFWKVYPKKVGKPIAQAKWNAITSETGLTTRTLDKDSGTYVEIQLKATPEEILEGAKRYERHHRRQGTGQYGYVDDGKFLLNAATFLNQGRWMDWS